MNILEAKQYLNGEGYILIDEKSEYYVVGLKPNVSRISIKFIYRKSFLDNIF